jgi:allantoin racemase
MVDGALQRIAVVVGSGKGRQTSTSQAPIQIRAIAGAGFLPEQVETRFGAFCRTPYASHLSAIGNVDAAIAAEKEGYAAFFLNTFGDYGLAECRSAVDIPVVGAGEAAMLTAAALGRRFAIVTVWPRSMNFLYDERISATRMADRCVVVKNVLDDAETDSAEHGDLDSPIAQMRSGKSSIIDRIVEAAEEAIAENAADTIVLGCTCMSPVAEAIAARLSVPVINPTTVGYKMAETLAQLHLTQSPIAYPTPTPERRAMLGQLLSGATVTADDDDCEICVVAQAAAE